MYVSRISYVFTGLLALKRLTFKTVFKHLAFAKCTGGTIADNEYDARSFKVPTIYFDSGDGGEYERVKRKRRVENARTTTSGSTTDNYSVYIIRVP